LPKPKPDESRDDFLSRCMGDAEANSTFPDRDQRYAFCNSVYERANQEATMLRNKWFLATASLQGPLRTEQLMGRDYLVVPATLVQGQILHNNLGATFLPPEAITDKWAQEWNGVPVVVHDHPSQRGVPVSARSPEVLQSQGVGYVFRARAVRNGTTSLKGEVWLDLARAEQVSELQTIVQRLRAGEKVELSTGFSTMAEEAPGVYNGEAYDRVLHPGAADHLAIFADKVGACSVEDGCGLGVNGQPQDGEGSVDPDNNASQERGVILRLAESVLALAGRATGIQPPTEPKAPPVTGPDSRRMLRQLKSMGLNVTDIGKALGCPCATIAAMERGDPANPPEETVVKLKALVDERLAANVDQSDEERRMALVNALEGKFGGEGKILWIDAVYSDQKRVVFGVVHDTLSGRKEELYQTDYEIGDNSEVTFADPVAVVRRVVYEATANSSKEHTPMPEEKGKVENQQAPTEPKEPQAPAKVENQAPTEPKVTPPTEPKAEPKGDEKDAVINELREQLRAQGEKLAALEKTVEPAVKERDRERQVLVKELAANERVPFDEAELEAKPLEELRKLSSMARGETYAGRGGPQETAANTKPSGPQYAEPVPYFLKQGEGATKKEGE